VVAYRAALALDEAEHHEDEAVRRRQGQIAALLTPLVKAQLTQQAFDTASNALQVFGGYGYTRPYGVEQTLRDCRIAMVYEGTNEIQAIDLLQRKVLADGGTALALLIEEFHAEVAACGAEPALRDFAEALLAQCDAATQTTQRIAERAKTDPQAALRAADAYLQAFGHLLLAWAWAASARAAQREPDAGWAGSKTERMRYGLQWLLPAAAACWHRASALDAELPSLHPSA
jgi:hypothetical protein